MFRQGNAFFNGTIIKRTVFLLLLILIFGEILLYNHREIFNGMYLYYVFKCDMNVTS